MRKHCKQINNTRDASHILLVCADLEFIFIRVEAHYAYGFNYRFDHRSHCRQQRNLGLPVQEDPGPHPREESNSTPGWPVNATLK
jgi:hypothetical protein